MQVTEKPFTKAEVDSAKGLGIILVVIGHNTAPVFDQINVYMYHMPLFFLLSGIGLNARYGLRDTLVSSAKSLLLYAAAMTLVYTAVGFLIQQAYGIRLIPEFGFSLRYATTRLLTGNGHDALLFLVGWFLVALFFVRVLGFALIKLLDRLLGAQAVYPLAAAGVGLVYAGMAWTAPLFQSLRVPSLNLLTQVLVGGGFLLLGYLCSRSAGFWRLMRSPLTTLALMVALYEAVVGLRGQPMSMAWSEYPSGFPTHILTALLGSLTVLSAAAVLAQTRHNAVLARLGTHSKTIMAHHLFVFTLLNVALIQAGVVRAADVGIWYSWNNTVTWPVYVGLGVALPVAGAHLLRRLLRRLPPVAVPVAMAGRAR